jgi:beta-glucosidase
LAHGTAMERLRGMGQKNVGIVLNFEHSIAGDATPEAAAAADLQDQIANRWFIEALTKGAYPPDALAGFLPHMPKGWEADLALISKPLDFLGVNYYTRNLWLPDPTIPWPSIKLAEGALPKTQMGWEIYPDGLYSVLTRMARDYVGDLPIYVTENGMAWDDTIENGAVYDPVRHDYLNEHIKATLRALKDGANMKGYFCWSLLDNYEWSLGYERRFGIVHVDFDTLERTPKASYHALKAALAQ